MKLEIDSKNRVQCPRNSEKLDSTTVCKKCCFLGWVSEGKVTCRWSELKEKQMRKEVIYTDSAAL